MASNGCVIFPLQVLVYQKENISCKSPNLRVLLQGMFDLWNLNWCCQQTWRFLRTFVKKDLRPQVSSSQLSFPWWIWGMAWCEIVKESCGQLEITGTQVYYLLQVLVITVMFMSYSNNRFDKSIMIWVDFDSLTLEKHLHSCFVFPLFTALQW